MSLEKSLTEVYGVFPKQVFQIYAKINPLHINQQDYWVNVNCFLEELHKVLYAKSYEYNLENIAPENYFCIVQNCVLHSFDIFQRIQLGNTRDRKYAKDISNCIAHDIIHDYLTQLRSSRNTNNPDHPTPYVSHDRYSVNAHPQHMSPSMHYGHQPIPIHYGMSMHYGHQPMSMYYGHQPMPMPQIPVNPYSGAYKTPSPPPPPPRPPVLRRAAGPTKSVSPRSRRKTINIQTNPIFQFGRRGDDSFLKNWHKLTHNIRENKPKEPPKNNNLDEKDHLKLGFYTLHADNSDENGSKPPPVINTKNYPRPPKK